MKAMTKKESGSVLQGVQGPHEGICMRKERRSGCRVGEAVQSPKPGSGGSSPRLEKWGGTQETPGNLSDHHHETCSAHTGLGWVLQSQLLRSPHLPPQTTFRAASLHAGVEVCVSKLCDFQNWLSVIKEMQTSDPPPRKDNVWVFIVRITFVYKKLLSKTLNLRKPISANGSRGLSPWKN